MEITSYITASLILGLAGSLHCIGMCGPLVSVLESVSIQKRWSLSQLLYHMGRWTTYSALGLIIGSIGQGFATLGLQRWAVLLAGIAMFLLLFFPSLSSFIKLPASRLAQRLRAVMSAALRSQKHHHRFLFGMLNGLLPCGLVFTALAGSLAADQAWKGGLFMLLFGVATTPALAAVSKLTYWIKGRFNAATSQRMQLAFSIIALLVLLRGANLGIPFVSPHFETQTKQIECCHK
jgi:sulfite exporter TauE/SafE